MTFHLLAGGEGQEYPGLTQSQKEVWRFPATSESQRSQCHILDQPFVGLSRMEKKQTPLHQAAHVHEAHETAFWEGQLFLRGDRPEGLC